MKRLDYYGGVKERFLTLLTSQANHYLAIADALPGFAGEAAVSAALLRAIERYQGAQSAGDGEWALVHARQARNLAEALRRIAPASSDALAELRAVVSADAAELDEALSTGFTGAERRSLLNQGLTATGIARLETETRGFVDDTFQMDAASVRAAHSATTATLADTVAGWNEIVDALEAVQDPAPAVDAGGPYSATAGASIMLAGTGSDDWDLDGDGGFDDATGAAPFVTFDHAACGPAPPSLTRSCRSPATVTRRSSPRRFPPSARRRSRSARRASSPRRRAVPGCGRSTARRPAAARR